MKLFSKNLFSKPIALLVIVALMVGFIVPTASPVISAVDDPADITALQEAWGEMYGKLAVGGMQMYPSAYFKGVTASNANLANADEVEQQYVARATLIQDNSLDIAGIEPSELGTHMAAYEIETVENPENETYTVVFSRNKYNSYSGIAYTGKYFAATNQDAFVWIYIQDVTKPGALVALTHGAQSGTVKNLDNKIYISEEDEGKWIKVNKDYFFGNLTTTVNEKTWDLGNWRTCFSNVAGVKQNNLNNSIQYFGLQAINGLKAKIIFGAPTLSTAQTVPTYSTIEEYLVAADALDVSVMNNAEPFTALVNHLKLKYADTCGADILKAAWDIDNGGITLDEGYADWTLNDWITNITPYDIAGTTFNDRFAKNWELYKAVYEDEYNIARIKAAWENVTVPNGTQLVPKYFADASTTTLKYPTNKTEVRFFGTLACTTKFKDLNSEGRTEYNVNATDSILYTKTNTNNGMKADYTMPVGTKDLFIYVKIENVDAPGTLMAGYRRGPSIKDMGKSWEMAFDANTTEEWQVISLGDILTGSSIWASQTSNATDWREVLVTGSSYNFNIRHLVFQVVGEGAQADITFGPVVAAVGVDVPTTYATLDEWVAGAKALLKQDNIMGGTAELEAVIDDIVANDPDLKNYYRLHDDWTAVNKVDSLYGPFYAETLNDDNASGKVYDELYDISDDRWQTSATAGDTYVENYGDKYAQITIKDAAGRTAVTPTDLTNTLILARDGKVSGADRIEQGTNINATYKNINDIYVRFKITDVRNGGKLGAYITNYSKDRGAATGWEMEIPSADEWATMSDTAKNKVYTVSIKEVICGTYWNSSWTDAGLNGATSYNNVNWKDFIKTYGMKRLGLQPLNGADFDIEVGTLLIDDGAIVTPGATFEETLANATAYAIPAGFTDKNDAFATTVAALNAAKQSGDATGDGNVNAIDVLRVKRYLVTKGNGIKCYMFAADVNGDESLDANDLMAIIYKILGKPQEV